MRQATYQIRNNLWDRLKVVFDKYASSDEEIATSKVQEIVRDALGETSRAEIDYVIKNMFRLDSDGSGTVSFHQFGNFLFKRHCGEMSLQKMHKADLISNGAQRKITSEEFWKLLNNAYTFLKVECPRNVCDEVFAEADKDKDGLITYVQYFQFIDKYICQSASEYAQYSKSPEKKVEKEPEPEPVDLGREWHSRLRLYLWAQLRYLYELYVATRVLPINDQHIRGLLLAILGPISDMEMKFLLNGLFQLKGENLEFMPFAMAFIFLIAQLELSAFQRNHPQTKKHLNFEEFYHLLKNSFKFLKISRVRRHILELIFKKIDTNNDGLISFVQYLDWVKRYLAVDPNRGDEYYIKEDDAEYVTENDFLEQEIVPIPIKKQAPEVRIKIKFNFSNYDLAKRVRARVFELLIPFDANKDKKFDEPEIRNALITLLKQNEYELAYVTRNVFRYDRDNDKNVTYDELTNFCVEQHFGEMAIQRLHRKNSYLRGKERIMNKQQFGFTLNNALNYIQMVATQEQIDLIFSEIDLQKSGWITYEVYFLFLRYYFGSLSPVCQLDYKEESHELTEDEKWKNQLSGLSPLDRFIRWILDQLRLLFLEYDFNKNLVFEPEEIEAILKHIFHLNESQISYIMLHFFSYEFSNNKSLTFEELVQILISIYFIYFRLKGHRDASRGKDYFGKINLEMFIILVEASSFYLKFPFQHSDLIAVFKIIDTDNDGWITYREYINFILKYLGRDCIQWDDDPKKTESPVKQPKPSQQISDVQWDFIQAIWDELKNYFDMYDKGSKQYLTSEELKAFVIEVLNENSERELDYVMWNLFRVDPNSDATIQFMEFAPFILKHAGEIALQRFHKHQTAGKKNLTEEELFIVFSNAFSFLKSMPKSHAATKAIYDRIGKGSDPNYANYLSWITRTLASRYQK